jgi:hypothetical protein
VKVRLALVSLLLLLGVTTAALADLAPRFPWQRGGGIERVMDGRVLRSSDPGVPVVVSVDEKATEARLIVPKRFLKSVADLTGEGGPARAEARPFHWPIVGFLLPIGVALAGGGLWLLGVRPRVGRRGAVLLGLVLLGGVGATVAWGRAQLPPIPPHPPLKGQVTVEVVEEGDAVKLVLPRGMLKELVNKP